MSEMKIIGGQYDDPVERFFALARERQKILRSKESGAPWPWTSDPILQQYRFTNVFREDDRTTRWFRIHVRDPMRDRPEVLLATVLFRWFNRISTGEALFSQLDLVNYGSAFEYWMADGHYDTKFLRGAIRKHCGDGPYVTGAYIIQTSGAGKGKSKLDGVLKLVHNVATGKSHFPLAEDDVLIGWREVAKWCLELGNDGTGVQLQEVWEWLQGFPSMGPFMAQEVVTDLRHTALLEKATDINTWCHAGPGAARGLNRVRSRDKDSRVASETQLKEMRGLLTIAHCDDRKWPKSWPKWELHEVEMWLCEFDKYERCRLGEGRPKQVYRP
jgi:alpha-glutamyl/putrescinyl thymine pyrophosphorylase clade 1